MIKAGIKKEEYREIKEYYDKRLGNLFSQKRLAEIVFKNGYGKDAPTIKTLCSLELGYGNPEWGAELEKTYYVLRIHKIY